MEASRADMEKKSASNRSAWGRCHIDRDIARIVYEEVP